MPKQLASVISHTHTHTPRGRERIMSATQVISLPPLASSLRDQSSGGQVQYTFNSKVMVAAMLLLCIVVIFVVSLHVYAKWFWRQGAGPMLPLSDARNAPWRLRRRRLVVEGIDETLVPTISVGLDSATINSLPTFIYQASKHHHNDGTTEPLLECAVCLSEFQAYEKGRLLPNCNHSFHIGCIDMWFRSHATCPLCRAPVSPWPPAQHQHAQADALDTPVQSLPTAPYQQSEEFTLHIPLRNSSTSPAPSNRYPHAHAITPPLPLQGNSGNIQVQAQHQDALTKNDELLGTYDTHKETSANVQRHFGACGPSSTGSMSSDIQGQVEAGASIARCQSLGRLRCQSEDNEACVSRPIKSRSFRMSIKWWLSRDLSKGRGRIFPSAAAGDADAGAELGPREHQSSVMRSSLPLPHEQR